jgi:hypothetical protein
MESGLPLSIKKTPVTGIARTAPLLKQKSPEVISRTAQNLVLTSSSEGSMLYLRDRILLLVGFHGREHDPMLDDDLMRSHGNTLAKHVIPTTSSAEKLSCAICRGDETG